MRLLLLQALFLLSFEDAVECSGSGMAVESGSGSGSGMSSQVEPETPVKKNCELGYWGDQCDMRCNCNNQHCNQETGTCTCNTCYTGPQCGTEVTAAPCVKTFLRQTDKTDLSAFAGFVPEASANEIHRMLTEETSVPMVDVQSVTRKKVKLLDGSEQLRLECTYNPSGRFLSEATSLCKKGTWRATCICNEVENKCTFNI